MTSRAMIVVALAGLVAGCAGQEPSSHSASGASATREPEAEPETEPEAAPTPPANPVDVASPLVIDEDGVTELEPPRTTGGMPLMEALAARRSTRELSPKALPAQLVSELLWAAAGVNRAESGKRTAPSARNRQEIALYVTLEQGACLYDHEAHALKTLGSADLRAVTGKQPFVGKAPLNLVYVADMSKMAETSREDLARYSGADAAFMAQNAYLYCASAGLGTVVRGWIDREALGEALELREDQLIVLAQTFGYPEEATPTPPE